MKKIISLFQRNYDGDRLVSLEVTPGAEFPMHMLVRHGCLELVEAPRDFTGIREYLRTHDVEGIVWHHPDGRMVKVKGKDFGLKRPRSWS